MTNHRVLTLQDLACVGQCSLTAVLFMILNSNNRSTGEHKAFMESALAAVADLDITWKVVSFHHSIYSVANHAEDNDILAGRQELAPVFKELDVDVVLMGHDHVYCRTYMMDGLTPMRDASIYDDEEYSSITNPEGILYVTANSASGSKYYALKNAVYDYSAVLNQENVPNISRVDVSDGEFAVTTYRTGDMSIVDRFSIYKVHVHSEETIPAVAPSCTETGLTEGKWCPDCGETLVPQEEVPALGHNFVHHICEACGATDFIDINCGGDDAVCPGTAFADLPGYDSWAHAGIDFVLANQPMTGTGEAGFSPKTAMSRAMLVTVLYRLEGEPDGGSAVFSDVPEGKWLTEAVRWTAENGIVSGIGGGRFAPNANVTREQIAAILFGYAGFKGFNIEASAELAAFADCDMVSSYAGDAMKWAVALELVKGTSSDGRTYLALRGAAIREQVAAILMRFYQNVVK